MNLRTISFNSLLYALKGNQFPAC